MKISYHWLQSYFVEKLPEPSVLGDLLTMHSFEVEEIVPRGDDSIFDIDVLPNRGHDCLCHYGVAREVSAVTGMRLSNAPLKEALPQWPLSRELSVEIQEADLCPRYSTVLIKGIKVGPSPEWLALRLQAQGQKSINNVVDATNYVMFNLGQPLHAFDFARIEKRNGKAAITVRAAGEGEAITTLDGGEHAFTEHNLLIADGNTDTPLAIAGVKGGIAALIDETTRDIVLEAANFNRTSVRKTARALNLRTDASMRFEHEISPELTLYALRDAVVLIKECAGGETEGYVDVYPKKEEAHAVIVSLADVNNVLGASLSLSEATSALDKLGFSYKKEGETFTVDPPFERLDLRIKEDMVEEIGRINGYEHVVPRALPPASWIPAIDKILLYSHRARKVLAELGFSEVYTYVFVPEGEVEIANPLADDKRYLRGDLSMGLSGSLTLNLRNADLLGLSEIKIFEIGKVFRERRETDGSLGHTEHNALGIAIAKTKKSTNAKKEEAMLAEAIGALSQALGITVSGTTTNGVWEVNFDELVAKLPEPTAYEFSLAEQEIVKYKRISPYPFVLRDIALWTPERNLESGILNLEEEVRKVISEQAGDLLTQLTLFDVFEKDDKRSYAFRLIFQSQERTLTDTEVNFIMERITAALTNKGWQVR